MVKRKPNYLSTRNLLTKQEYQDYSIRKKIEARDKLEKQINEMKRQEKYQRTTSGKLGSLFSKGVRTLQKKGGVTQSLYQRSGQLLPIGYKQTIHSTSRGVKTGRVGRPRGSVKYVNPDTGQPIGVYEYRKILNARLRIEKAQALRQAAVTPEQQRYLAIIEKRKQYNQMSPERKTIPDTYGNVPMKNIFQEIDDASNIFP